MFDSFEVDPLASITSVLSKIALEKRYDSNYSFTRIDSWHKKGISYIKAIRDGHNPNGTAEERISSKGVISLAGEVVKLRHDSRDNGKIKKRRSSRTRRNSTQRHRNKS